MSKSMRIITPSGMIINTENEMIAQGFWMDGASVDDTEGNPVFTTMTKPVAKQAPAVYPVWLNEHEKDQLIAHWEKTGMFSTIINKIRSGELIKKTK